jgi:chromosome segregation ATPase
MSAFSLIIRMLSLAACGVAVFFWIDKQKVIAQKEAIIQETEHLVGYPTTERKKTDKITLPASVRKEYIADLRAEHPNDVSFQRMEELRSRLVRIQKSNTLLGHQVKTIGGYDPNKHLTLRSHIEGQAQEIEKLLEIEDSLNAEKEKLAKELANEKALLGEEILKVDELRKIVEKNEANYRNLENKHQELKSTYVSMISKNEERIQQIREDFKAQLTSLRLQVSQLQAIADERQRKILLLEQEKKEMFRMIKGLREQVTKQRRRSNN